MSPRLLAIHRTSADLLCTVAERATSFERTGTDADRDYVLPADYAPYRVQRIPLADTLPTLFPRKAVLLAAWNALASVREFTPEVLSNVLLVELDTVTDPLAPPRDLPLFERAASPPRPRATAAHPRAYRGTKHKPPKPQQVEPVDLRPHLCVPVNEHRILQELRPGLAAALRMLDKRHPRAEDVRRAGEACLQPFAQQFDPRHAKQIAALPPDFRYHFLWLLRGMPLRDCTALLAAFRTLELHRDEGLRAAVQVALATAGTRIEWLDVIALLPHERRTHLVEILIERHSAKFALDRRQTSDLVRASALSSDHVFRHRIAYCLDTIAQGKRLDYALDGLQLANEEFESLSFDLVSDATGVIETVLRITSLFPKNDQLLFGTHLWNYCGRLRGFQELLDRTAWERLDPTSIPKLINLLTSIHQADDPVSRVSAKWNWALRHLADLIELVESIEVPYRLRALAALRDFIHDWNDAHSLTSHWPKTKSLIRAYCRPPYATHPYAGWVLVPLAQLPERDVARLVAAPERSWNALDRATRREDPAEQVYFAIWTLADEMPRIVVDAFVAAPRALFDAARTIGVMHRETRERLIAAFLRTRIATIDVSTSDATSLVRVIDAQLPPGGTSAVSKRLREHVTGCARLSPAQLERDLSRIRAAWPGIQFAALEHAALEQIARGLPEVPRDARSRHAVLMMHDMDEHRRGMRRLLRACFEGKPDYAETHPASRRWLAAHPRIDAAKWLGGICARIETQSSGMIELRVERDPLEALRLGSYFGTCLGLGGIMSQSAGAVVLDVNKQVIYARTVAGRVVARQLIAVAEDDRVVCFDVYPRSAPADVRAAFKAYDERLAAHLGLPLYGRGVGPSEYKIAEVLSRYCWDDMAWDFGKSGTTPPPRASK